MFQWLGLSAFTTKGLGSVSKQEAKIPYGAAKKVISGDRVVQDHFVGPLDSVED